MTFTTGKLGQDVLWNLAGLVVIGASGIALNGLIAAAYPDPGVLGVFNQAFAAYVLVSQFAAGGVHLSTQRATAQHSGDRDACVQIISSAMLLTIGLSVLFSAAYYYARGSVAWYLDSPGVAVGMAWSTPGLFCFAINKTLLGAANGLRCMRVYAVAQSLRGLLTIATTIAAIGLALPGEALAVVLSVAEACVMVFLLVCMQRWLRPPPPAALRRWTRAHLAFGVRGAGSGVLLELNTRVDVLLLGWFRSDAVVGVYSFAAMLAQGFAQFPIVIGTNLNPLMAQHLAAGRHDELAQLVRTGRRSTFWLMLALTAAALPLYPLGVWLVADSPEYAASWPMFAILMAGVALAAGQMPFGQILLQAGRPGLHTLMTAAVVVFNAAGNLALIPLWGGVGSAVATAASYVLTVVLLKTYARQVCGVRL